MRKRRNKKASEKSTAVPVADLVQTPTVYSAWHPAAVVDAKPAAPARAQLEAAERMFDSFDKDVDDGAAPAFIQLAQSLPSATTLDVNSSTAAARVVLEQFGRNLGSTSLLEIARGPLNALRLQNLWRRLEVVSTSSTAQSSQQAQQMHSCSEFRNEIAARRHKARLAALEANGSARGTVDERHVLQGAAGVRKHILRKFAGASSRLHELRSQISDDTKSMVVAIQKVRQLSDTAATAASLESLGRAAGLAAAGEAELQDIVGATVNASSEAERAQTTALVQLHAHLSVKKRDASSASVGTTGGKIAGVNVAHNDDLHRSGDLEDRYQKMCDWATEAVAKQKRQEDGVKRAVHDALAVITYNPRY